MRAQRLGAFAAAGVVSALAFGGLPAPARSAAPAAALPPALSARLGVNLGTALVLAGAAVSIGHAAALMAAVPTLGRRLPNLTRVYALPTLREGARGSAVRLAQARLDGLGDHLALDGVFGPLTEAAVGAFDRARALSPADQVGRAAWLALLGTRMAAHGRTAWALAAAYDTSPASLAAWNASVGGPASWARPLYGALWVMPPDVRPAAEVLGTGAALETAAPPPRSVSRAAVPGATQATTGAVGARPHAVMLVLAVTPGTAVGQVESLAAWLGGRSIVATVVLPPALLTSRGASALALEGEDLGVEVGAATSAASLDRGLAGAVAATGERPAVAYGGLYPSAAAAAVAARAGLALVVGGQAAGPATTPAGGGVYVLSGPPARLEAILPALLARARRAGDGVGAVRSALRLATAPA